jgi:hypothetical protein
MTTLSVSYTFEASREQLSVDLCLLYGPIVIDTDLEVTSHEHPPPRQPGFVESCSTILHPAEVPTSPSASKLCAYHAPMLCCPLTIGR